MSSSPILIHAITAFALASLASGCYPDPCIENGLEADAKYRVTFLEPYNEDSTLAAWDPEISEPRPACDLELAPMTSFEATALYRESMEYPNSCTSWVLEVDAFTGAGEIVNLAPGGTSMFTRYRSVASWHAQVDISGCNADWVVELLAPEGGDPFRALRAAEPPPLLVRRRLSVEEQDGCGDVNYSCSEFWLASLERVQ